MTNEFPSEAFDRWLTKTPPQYEYPPEVLPDSPCVCGHSYEAHGGESFLCYTDEADCECAGFVLDEELLEEIPQIIDADEAMKPEPK